MDETPQTTGSGKSTVPSSSLPDTAYTSTSLTSASSRSLHSSRHHHHQPHRHLAPSSSAARSKAEQSALWRLPSAADRWAWDCSCLEASRVLCVNILQIPQIAWSRDFCCRLTGKFRSQFGGAWARAEWLGTNARKNRKL